VQDRITLVISTIHKHKSHMGLCY